MLDPVGEFTVENSCLCFTFSSAVRFYDNVLISTSAAAYAELDWTET